MVFLKRAKRSGVSALLKPSASNDSFAPDDGETSTQDESQLGQQFDLDKLHTTFGGRCVDQHVWGLTLFFDFDGVPCLCLTISMSANVCTVLCLRNTAQRFSIDEFEQWMMREDVQRDVALAGAMASA